MIGELIIALLISNASAQTPPANQGLTPPPMNFGSPPQPAPQPANPPPAAQPNQAPPEISSPPPGFVSPKLKAALKEIEATAKSRNKSPFMIPTELYLRIKRKQREAQSENTIDAAADPKVRYPLRTYTLIGVLSGVNVPKALIRDRDGKIHTFRSKEFIANGGGYIAEIGNGEIIVVEQGAEYKLKIRKEKE